MMRSADPFASDERRARRPFRLWGCALAVAAVVGLIFLAGVAVRRSGPRRAPSDRVQRLDDGTFVVLEAVTYGKTHRFEAAPGALSWLRDVLPFLPGRQVEEEQMDTDGVVFWLTRRDAGGRRYLGFEWWSDYTVTDEHGCRFGGGERSVQARSNGGSEGSSVGRGTQLQPARRDARVIVANGELTTLPRRSRTLKLRLYDRKRKPIEFVVPNPGHASYPVWKPEPLPATKRDGDVSITLERFALFLREATYGGDPPMVVLQQEIQPTFHIAQRGRPTEEWRMTGTTISDATGNVSRGSPWELCPYEPAWKLRATFYRSDRARFGANETWTLRGVPVPKPGAAVSLSGGASVQGVTLEPVAMAGAGEMTYENGVLVKAGRSPAVGGGFGMSVTSTGSGATAKITTTVNVGLPNVAVRVTGMTGSEAFTVWATDTQGRRIFSSNSSVQEDLRFFSFPLPADMRRIDLTFAVHKPRVAEFVFKPPLPVRYPDPSRYIERKEYAKAIAEYRRLIAMEPDEAGNYNWLAWFLATGPAQVRDARAALPLALKAVRMEPGTWAFLNTLGVVYYRLGRYREAVETLRRADRIDRSPPHAYDYLFLAMSYQRLGQRQKARTCYRISLDSVRPQAKTGNPWTGELGEFRAEAEAVLGIHEGHEGAEKKGKSQKAKVKSQKEGVAPRRVLKSLPSLSLLTFAF